jgi:Uncharacterized protein containing a von Willebrand factor type A (vWA) domain
MNLGVHYPWVLVFLPLSLVPFFFQGQKRIVYSSLTLLPPDRISDVLGSMLRGIAALMIVFLVLGLSGLYWPSQEIERIGQGAEMVLLLDRSRSMDQPFAGEGFIHPFATTSHESKGTVARKLLAQFVQGRHHDRFGMVVFSTYPIQVLPLTDKQDIIQAAITAGNVGKGLAETDLGAGLESAFKFFEDRPYTGSRIVILVSDGAAQLELATQIQIKNLMQRNRVTLYWIYIRSRNSPGLFISNEDSDDQPIAPEVVLHRFFSSMDTPYRAYLAENPQALERAIADVNRLQNLPVHYKDILPPRDLSGACYALALALMAVLIAAKLMELNAWH